jgi:hypothetical protein
MKILNKARITVEEWPMKVEQLKNYVFVRLTTEIGCKPSDGEYELVIIGFLGGLDISSNGGIDDITLLKECVENEFDFNELPDEGFAEIILKESGEWEDVFWNKYYVIEKYSIFEA